jgi:hypothetical protein
VSGEIDGSVGGMSEWERVARTRRRSRLGTSGLPVCEREGEDKR